MEWRCKIIRDLALYAWYWEYKKLLPVTVFGMLTTRFSDGSFEAAKESQKSNSSVIQRIVEGSRISPYTQQHQALPNRLWVSLGQSCFDYLNEIIVVDGRNPAPVDMVNIALFTGFHTCQVLQDFFHQQYGASVRRCWMHSLQPLTFSLHCPSTHEVQSQLKPMFVTGVLLQIYILIWFTHIFIYAIISLGMSDTHKSGTSFFCFRFQVDQVFHPLKVRWICLTKQLSRIMEASIIKRFLFDAEYEGNNPFSQYTSSRKTTTQINIQHF